MSRNVWLVVFKLWMETSNAAKGFSFCHFLKRSPYEGIWMLSVEVLWAAESGTAGSVEKGLLFLFFGPIALLWAPRFLGMLLAALVAL